MLNFASVKKSSHLHYSSMCCVSVCVCVCVCVCLCARDRDWDVTGCRFRDEQAQWRRAAKTYAARFPTARTKRSKRVSQTPALAANLPRIAMAAIDEFDVGVRAA